MSTGMGDISIKQLLKFFAVIAAITAVFISGAYFFLRWGINIELPPEKAGGPLPAIPGPKIEIKAPDEFELTPQIIYDGKSFQPQKVLRDGSGSIGCIVVVLNRSVVPLQIGLNPHRASLDPGPNYPAIAPGDKLQFDPRFVGIKELSFHNHLNPSQEFSVALGPKCQL